MPDLSTDVRYMKGIGEQRAKALSKLGIFTLRDLLSFFPRAYEDRTSFVPIALLSDGQSACVRAIVAAEPTLSRVRKGLDLVKLRVVDDSSSMNITFFNQSYIKNQLKTGESYVFYGKVNFDGTRREMTNPLFEPAESPGTVTGRIVPIYRLTAGISQKMLISCIRRGLDECGTQLPNALPAAVAQAQSLCQAGFAFENIHFPSDFAALELSRRRLIFEELFVLACALTQMKQSRVKKSGIIIHNPKPDTFYSALPFAPTGAQDRAIKEILLDMASGNAMNRLVQGDVGSGKTLVAAAAIWSAARSGAQSAFMAPTEILANQHFATLSELLEPFGVTVVKLIGSMTAKGKREARALLESGEAALAVGTHALITENVVFDKLALIVTDEQHRFGVNQRAALAAKGSDLHTLVMSATPIPRTLALMIYGDLDVSVIGELPPGRQKVDTFAVGEDMRQRINKFIEKQVSMGRQVFVVCPAIDENEENPQNIKTAVEHSEALQRLLPSLRVACIHGKMKSALKEEIMTSFIEGRTDVLVSTTVIEVGVDVPNASLIVVENAERFGLSQLHQLRGRVGRGKHKSYCVLFSDEVLYPAAHERLKVLEETNDGFKISEEDLKLRGPGDFFGSRQHGLPEMHIADLLTDVRLLKEAQDSANALLASDPGLSQPENACLNNRIHELFHQNSAAMN